MAAKYRELAGNLRAAISQGAYPAGSDLPAEGTLAARFAVSRETVRQALAILAAEGLIEKRRGSGSRVLGPAAGASAAVVVSYPDEYVFPELLDGVRAVLEAQGLATTVYRTQNRTDKEREILRELAQKPPRGLLMEGVRTALPNPNLDLYAKLAEIGLPSVFLFGCCAGLSDPVCLLDDNVGGGYQLVRYLCDLGHTEIAGIFKSDDLQGQQRYAGYANALRDAGLPLEDRHLLWFSSEDRRELLDGGNAAMLQHFIRYRLPGCTAAVCYNDEIAYALVCQLKAAGIAVPQSVSVAGFDNSTYSALSPVPLTTMSHDMNRLGRRAAELLLARMRGTASRPVPEPWTLTVRDSTAPPPAAQKT